MPPWMCGSSVLTRPSSISGKPVTVETPMTGRPPRSSVNAVPPVDINSKPRPFNPFANSTIPDLSETLNNALGMAIVCILRKYRHLDRQILDTPVTARIALGCIRGAFPGCCSRGRASTRGLFLCPEAHLRLRNARDPAGPLFAGVPPKQAGKKNDAHHRQGQVVQQRQGVWIH